MTALCYLPKLKRGLGLAFGRHCPHKFPNKCSLLNTQFFLTQCFLTQFSNFYDTHFFLLNISNNDREGKKGGKMEIHKFEYLESEKSFLDEVKSIFHDYLRL